MLRMFGYRSLGVALAAALWVVGCGPGEQQDPRDGGPGPDGSTAPDAASGWDSGPGPDGNGLPDATPQPDVEVPTVVPPLGGSSGGAGGGTAPAGSVESAGGVTYRIIVPGNYQASTPTRMMIVYSGVEGGQTMTNNLVQLSQANYAGLGDVIFAVLDGVDYNGNGGAGATVLDDVRARYNVDNDRTFLLSESAGTTAGLQLGFSLRQSYFAAYWANDVNAQATPAATAAELGFAPWGNAGPGGDWPDANAIVAGMQGAGYRLPADAPYSGAGSGTHGSQEQFLAAMAFFGGKSRQ